MKQGAWWGAVLLTAGVLAHGISVDTNASRAADPTPAISPAAPNARPDDALRSVHDIYPQAADIRLAMLAIPDPRVPRYRRNYDDMITAVEIGMATKSYVLDRFSFPWSARHDQSQMASAGVDGGDSQRADDPHYGMLLFRCDAWRTAELNCGADSTPLDRTAPDAYRESLIALYLIPETATYGLAPIALGCAMERIRSQLGNDDRLSSSPSHCPMAIGTAPGTAKLVSLPSSLCKPDSLVLLGPTLSGSLASIANTLLRLNFDGPASHVCAISSMATDPSNAAINGIAALSAKLEFHSRTVDDAHKLAALQSLTAASGVPASRIALLTEATTFGNDLCSHSASRYLPSDLDPAADRKIADKVDFLCANGVRMSFPPNIADLRSNFMQENADDSAHTPVRSLGAKHLPLSEGVNNGSEFPANRGASVTAASMELQLNQLIGELSRRAPRVVVVAATDVRDRLFLFEKLRDALPEVLLIDFEADQLLAHPDFIHASRGALSLASFEISCELLEAPQQDTELQSRQLQSWSSDGQGLLADTISALNSAVMPKNCLTLEPVHPPPADQPRIHVVTRHGLQSVATWRDKPSAGAEPTIAVYGVIFIMSVLLAAGAPYLSWPSRHALLGVTHRRQWQRLRVAASAAAAFGPAKRSLSLALLLAILWPLICRMIAANEHDYRIENGLGLGCLLAFFYLSAMAYARQRPFSLRLSLLQSWAFAAAAFVMQAAQLWNFKNTEQLAFDARLDHDNLWRLGMDWNSGIAYLGMLQVATAALLYAAYASMVSALYGRRDLDAVAAAYQALRATNCKRAPAGLRQIDHSLDFDSALIGALGALLMLVPLRRLIYDDVRLTIFGDMASWIAVIGMLMTSFAAFVMAGRAIKIARRLLMFCKLLNRDGAASADTGTRDPYPQRFAITPVLAKMPGRRSRLRRLLTAPEDLSRYLQPLLSGQPDIRSRLAAYVLFTTEIKQFRWLAAGAALCALAGVAQAYLFPVSEVDFFLIFNLCVALAICFISGLYALAFERDAVLSRTLCDRSAEMKLSSGLLLYIAAPIITLAASLAFTEVPGVFSWSGGLLGVLLGQVGLPN